MNTQRIFIVHGWGGSPDEPLLTWLKSELKEKVPQVKTSILEMPDSENPKIAPWVEKLSSAVGTLTEDAYFIGHSIGCQAIMRYLETKEASSAKAGGALFLAPWVTLMGIDNPEDAAIGKQWTDAPLDAKKVRSKAHYFSALFSDNDPFVALTENRQFFEEELGATVEVLSGYGHFGQDDVKELPEALAAITNLLARKSDISFKVFSKMDLRVAKIVEVSEIEGADKLYKLTLDIGDDTKRTICSGIRQHYTPEELVGQFVATILNLEPRTMRGVESHGMMLAVSGESGKPILLQPAEDIFPGARIG